MNKIKISNKTVLHYININGVNKLHSWDSAAFIPNGDKTKAEYHLFGIKYSKEDWQKLKDNKENGEIQSTNE